MKYSFLFILFLFFSLSLFAQKDTLTVQKDDSEITQKTFNQKHLENYKSQRDFNYKVVKNEPTIFSKLWNWLKRVVKKYLSLIFDDIKPVIGFLASILRVVPYLIAGLILYFIVKFFLKVNTRSLNLKSTNKSIAKITEEEELINHKDLFKLIQLAIADKNYRLAIRYYYLLVLQKLSEKEFIYWQQEKTNEDYMQEMEQHKLQLDFEKTTYLYDFVWYGNFAINKVEYDKAENDFLELIHKLS